MQGNTRMYTAAASADIGVWDVQTSTCLGRCFGHATSVKSISPMHMCEDVIASGTPRE